jgi:hypothetical protein
MCALYGTKLLLAIIRAIWKPRGACVEKLNEKLEFKTDDQMLIGM